MRTLKILFFLLTLSSTCIQAQDQDQATSIEISNTNGNLFISFKNGELATFVVNDIPVAKEKYSAYQDILDDFSDEEIKEPTPQEPPVEKKGEQLKKLIVDYLMNNGYINSYRKYKVQLKKKYLKVNGDKMPIDLHEVCLDYFKQIYQEDLNSDSEVYFKKYGNKSRGSISISN